MVDLIHFTAILGDCLLLFWCVICYYPNVPVLPLQVPVCCSTRGLLAAGSWFRWVLISGLLQPYKLCLVDDVCGSSGCDSSLAIGFGVANNIKNAVERACRGVVSYADILPIILLPQTRVKLFGFWAKNMVSLSELRWIWSLLLWFRRRHSRAVIRCGSDGVVKGIQVADELQWVYSSVSRTLD
ncbi:peroxidase 4 [Tanacetum coccineum]